MSINILIIEPDHWLGLVEKNVTHNLKEDTLDNIFELKKIYNINLITDTFYKGLPIDNEFKLDKLIDGDNIVFYNTQKKIKKKTSKIMPSFSNTSSNNMVQIFQEDFA